MQGIYTMANGDKYYGFWESGYKQGGGFHLSADDRQKLIEGPPTQGTRVCMFAVYVCCTCVHVCCVRVCCTRMCVCSVSVCCTCVHVFCVCVCCTCVHVCCVCVCCMYVW